LLLIRNSGRPLPSELGKVPPGFDAWFQRATHPELEQRFQSARELGTALARVCGNVRVQRTGPMAPTEELAADSSDNTLAPMQLRSGSRLRWTPARVAGLSLLVSLPVAAGAFWQHQRQRAARPTVEPTVAALDSAPEVATLALRPAPPPPPADTSAPPAVAPAGASTLVPVDVNGRSIRMTLEPLQ
jgi:hypothetical protein